MRFAIASGTAVLCAAALVAMAVSSERPMFTDRTAASGIRFVLQNSATADKHQIETMPGGVAVLDFDNDGRLDIYFTNGAKQPSLEKTDPAFYNRLYRNRGNWVFEDVTGRAGLQGHGFNIAVAPGDYDNDGFTDLYVTGVRGSSLYRNRGDGTFQDVTESAHVGNNGRWGVSAAWFDIDNDGDLDLLVANYVKWDPAAEPFCGEAGSYRTYCHPRFYEGLPNTLYRNNGDGTFTDVSEASGIAKHVGKGMGIAVADYDLDGRMDVFVANDTVPNFLFHNEGGGRFREMGFRAGVAMNDDGRSLSSMGADFRDLDNDGRPDLFVTALTNETFPLYRNTAPGAFADLTYRSRVGPSTMPLSGWSAGVFDFNNDGRKDIFAACGDVQDNTELFSSRHSRQQNLLLMQSGDGTFAARAVGTAALHRGAAFGDFDGDGNIDVVVTALNGPAVLLRNDAPASHWIGFNFRGTKSSRDAIGTRVHITTATGEQWNHVTTAVGYASGSTKAVHFGLGQMTAVRSVEIHWPSGTVQRLQSVALDRYTEIVEP